MESINDYTDYLSSFTNAFGINPNPISPQGDYSSSCSEPCRRCKDDYVYNYVCSDKSVQRDRVKRSNSWSHIGSVASQARSTSLVPSNIIRTMYEQPRRNTHPNDLSSDDHLDEFSMYASGFSMLSSGAASSTVSTKSHNGFLRRRSASYNLGSTTDNYKDEIVQMSYIQVHEECTARLRSNTSPPSISITNEYGSSTEVHVTDMGNFVNEDRRGLGTPPCTRHVHS